MRTTSRAPGRCSQPLGRQAADALLACAPLLVLLIIAALAAPQLLGGWLFTANALRFDFSRIDPIAGFGRLFSLAGRGRAGEGAGEGRAGVGGGRRGAVALQGPAAAARDPAARVRAAQAARLVVASLALIAGALALVAAVDVPFQLWRHADEPEDVASEEVRRENREIEGDPQREGARSARSSARWRAAA